MTRSDTSGGGVGGSGVWIVPGVMHGRDRLRPPANLASKPQPMILFIRISWGETYTLYFVTVATVTVATVTVAAIAM